MSFFTVNEYTFDECAEGWIWIKWNGDKLVAESPISYASKDDARRAAVEDAGGKIHHVNPLGLPTNQANIDLSEVL